MADTGDQQHSVDGTGITGVVVVGDRNGDLDAVFVMTAHSTSMEFSIVKMLYVVNSLFSTLKKPQFPIIVDKLLQ